MNQATIYSADFGRIKDEVEASVVLELLEVAIRATISQFGEKRVAMMLLSDDYLSTTIQKAA
jgi:hypothetical protein